ncbi:XdhC family protein [Frisingicoccus sp.]|uniref:XdhC family protein n=1 Tax=Frisingicoccus sp. TaxID=1918627 RepID=UPI003AB34B47
MQNVYSDLLSILRSGQPATLYTRKTGDGRVEKWVESGNAGSAEKNADFQEYYMPEERLIILGGGHVSRPLALFGAECGFAVTVVDDRPSFAGRDRFPKARQVLCESFERCFDKLNITSGDYVAVVTRGHRYDMDCLRALLSGKEPAYMGMMGSRRRVSEIRKVLLSEGYGEKAVDSIHMPIGLPIGALSPAEIAVSVLAEMIQKRWDNRLPMEKAAADADFRVLEKLAVENGPCAVATVLSTKGPTPRQSGAKMIVYPGGKIYGSIGGGCAEAAIIREALHYIGSDRCTVKTVDMTKDISEEDLMACGGVMDVFIEGSNVKTYIE